MSESEETINTIRVSISFLLLFAPVLIQEAILEPVIHVYQKINGGIERSDGYLALSILYITSTISCFFIAPVVTKISGKWAICAGIAGLSANILNFFFINRIYLMLCAVLSGFGTCLLWVGQGQYITDNCSNENMEKNTALQWGLFKLALIIGGGFTVIFYWTSSIEESIETGSIKVIASIFAIFQILSFINTVFLPQSGAHKTRKNAPFSEITLEFLKLSASLQMILLSVFFFYLGFLRSFWIAIFPTSIKFTKVLGANTTVLLAFGMMTNGFGQVSAAVLMVALGIRARKIGKDLIVIFVLILHIFLFLLIFSSFPNKAPSGETYDVGPVFKPTVFIAMFSSFFLGFGDAILHIQVYAFISDLYKHKSSHGFANYRLFSALSSGIIFFIARRAHLLTHLVLLVSTAVASSITILYLQRIYLKEQKSLRTKNDEISEKP